MSRILTSVEDFDHRLKPSEMPKKRKSTAGSKVHIKVQSQKGLQLSFLKQLMPSVSNHFLPAKTTINKGDHIIGRVIGKSIDDNSGFCSILLEAVDGKAHIISETPAKE